MSFMSGESSAQPMNARMHRSHIAILPDAASSFSCSAATCLRSASTSSSVAPFKLALPSPAAASAAGECGGLACSSSDEDAGGSIFEARRS